MSRPKQVTNLVALGKDLEDSLALKGFMTSSDKVVKGVSSHLETYLMSSRSSSEVPKVEVPGEVEVARLLREAKI